MTFAILAMTQDEAIAAIRQQVGGGAGSEASGAYVWMALAALAMSLVLLVMRWRRTQWSRTPVANDHGKLVKELRREVGLSRAEVRVLKQEVVSIQKRAGVKVASPLTAVLCPSLKTRPTARPVASR